MKNNITPIICVGGANIDHKFFPHQPIVLATSNPMTSSTSHGGVARNVAENLARLTQSIYLHTLVGDDADGLELLAGIKSLGANTELSIIKKGADTSHYYAIMNESGDLHSAFSDMRICEDLTPEQFTKNMQKWPENSLIFLDTNFPLAVINAILNYPHKCKICLDPVSVAKCKKIPADLHSLYLMKPNRDEAAALTGVKINCPQDGINAAKKLLARGVQQVVLSLGKDGYIIANATQQIWRPASSPQCVVDVNGAGDAFTAGILLGLQQALPLEQACEYGAAAASLTLQTQQTVAETITITDLNTAINSQQKPQSRENFLRVGEG